MILTITTDTQHQELLKVILESLTVKITTPPGTFRFGETETPLVLLHPNLKLPATDNTVIAVMMEVIKYKKSLQDVSTFWYTLEVDGCD